MSGGREYKESPLIRRRQIQEDYRQRAARKADEGLFSVSLPPTYRLSALSIDHHLIRLSSIRAPYISHHSVLSNQETVLFLQELN